MKKMYTIKLLSLWAVSVFYATAPAQTGEAEGWKRTTAEVDTASAFRITVPKDARVFVGEKDQSVTVIGNYLKKHYIPFTEKQAVYVAPKGDKSTYYYNVSKIHNYRVSREGSLTHVGVFTPSTAERGLEITEEQLNARSPKEIDHNVNNLSGRNVADVLLNINSQGFLRLPLRNDTTFQLINLRVWQAIDTDVNNYFIEPDFHYKVLDEEGNVNDQVITIDSKGLITPIGEGTVIVQVSYDAMMCAHTKNVGNNGAAFFGALWPENTGTFVVSVGTGETGIQSNMFVGEYWNGEGSDKVDSVYIDAEHDVLYYEASTGGFDYTFKPENVQTVALAQPTIETNGLSYRGFSSEGVTQHEDGRYTLRLVHGRNIIRLTSATGVSEYQVISAKPVSYTITNLTNPNPANHFAPGDEASIVFNTLYHPANKLSGIYNMSAGIQYTGASVDFPLILGPGQYTFASKAQEYKIKIPEDFTGDEYVLTNGVIKVKGYGSFYGEHRKITLQNGVSPNLNAGVREAYFGSLPDIRLNIKSGSSSLDTEQRERILVYPNPFADYLIITSEDSSEAVVYNIAGKAVWRAQLKRGENTIDTSHLGKGIYLLQYNNQRVKLVK